MIQPFNNLTSEKLNQNVKIIRSEERTDSFGNIVYEEKLIKFAWVHIIPYNNQVSFIFAKLDNATYYNVQMRFSPEVGSGDMIVLGKIKLVIRTAIHDIASKKYSLLTAEYAPVLSPLL